MLFLRLTDGFVRVDWKQLQNWKSPATIEANVVPTKNRNGKYKKTFDAPNVARKKNKKGFINMASDIHTISWNTKLLFCIGTRGAKIPL